MDKPDRSPPRYWCWKHGSLGDGTCPLCAAPVPAPPAEPTLEPSPLQRDLTSLLNRHCAENASDSPDFVLGRFLRESLQAFDHATKLRDEWWGFKPWQQSIAAPAAEPFDMETMEVSEFDMDAPLARLTTAAEPVAQQPPSPADLPDCLDDYADSEPHASDYPHATMLMHEAARQLRAQRPPPTLALKMRAVELAIAALEGDEIVWPDHKILHAAESLARRYAQMLENDHE